MTRLKCDFCSLEDVHWGFPARDFTRVIVEGEATLTHGSRGGWAACNHCHALIVRGDREGLTRRSALHLVRNGGLPQSAIARIVRELRAIHDDFWSNREGEPVPTSPTSPDPTRRPSA